MKTQYTFNGTLNNLKERIHGWLYSTELEHIVQAGITEAFRSRLATLIQVKKPGGR